MLTIPIKEEADCKIDCYWKLSFARKTFEDEKSILSSIETRLKDSVKSRLVSDAPLGVLLSGGVDSSLVVAMMSEFKKPKEIKTFSIGFKEKGFDEL